MLYFLFCDCVYYISNMSLSKHVTFGRDQDSHVRKLGHGCRRQIDRIYSKYLSCNPYRFYKILKYILNKGDHVVEGLKSFKDILERSILGRSWQCFSLFGHAVERSSLTQKVLFPYLHAQSFTPLSTLL